jgi:hypothetical protein
VDRARVVLVPLDDEHTAVPPLVIVWNGTGNGSANLYDATGAHWRLPSSLWNQTK